MERTDNNRFEESEILKVKSLQNLYDMKVQRRIGINLRRVRNESGMTMQELHYMTQIPYAIISKIENLHVDQNPKKTSVDMCRKFAIAFQMSLEELTNELLRPVGEENESTTSSNDYATNGIPEFPANLVADVLENSNVNPYKINYKVVYDSIHDLSEREQDFITKKYRDRMTYDEIGKMNGITRERCRQVIEKGIRKMQRSEKKNEFILIEPNLYNTILGENEKLKAENEYLRKAVKSEMKEILDIDSDDVIDCIYERQLKKFSCDDKDIEELDLSVRAYNCLKHIGVNTVGDVARLTVEDLNRTRNLGERCSKEIQTKLYEKYGIRLPSC